MNLVDANVLLYAVNEADPKHARSRAWLDGALNGGDTVAFAWVALLAFLRLSTSTALFPRPLPAAGALHQVRAWITHPASVLVQPTSRHLEVLTDLLEATETEANLSNDAHLAALAIEYGATVVTFSADVGRFPGVEWRPPPDLPA